MLGLAATGCSSGQEVGRWSVRAVSADGRVLHLGVDVSCDRKVGRSHVHEYGDRVFVELDTSAPGGSCKSALTVRAVDVRLSSPLGARWVDGACSDGCPTRPDRAPLRCSISGAPFGFGYLPSGWLTARNPKEGSVAAYQSATGDATVELGHNSSDGVARQGRGEDAYVLGNTVPVETVSGGYAVSLELAGTGPACGHWRLVGLGIPQDTFLTVVQQLFPR
jgi:hypothetical protein